VLLLTQCYPKKRNHFEHAVVFSVMLSLAFLPHTDFVSLQVENVTVYLANSGECYVNSDSENTMLKVQLVWLSQMQGSQVSCSW